jgi:hypothetical protein
MERLTREQVRTPEQAKQYAKQRKEDEIKELLKIKEEMNKGKDWVEIQNMNEWREPLAIEEWRTFKVELSWGGDADGFLIDIDKDGWVIGGRYYWADWGIYEEVELTEEEASMVADIYGLLEQ